MTLPVAKTSQPSFAAKRWLAGAPAVAAVLVGGFIALYVWSTAPGRTIEWYRQQADESFDAGDYKTALVCYARVSQARPADSAAAFSLFQCMEAAGQRDAAASLLARLAPAEAPGYPPAQVLFAKRLMANDASPAAAKRARAHLRLAISAGSDDLQMNTLLAEAERRTSAFSAAPDGQVPAPPGRR